MTPNSPPPGGIDTRWTAGSSALQGAPAGPERGRGLRQAVVAILSSGLPDQPPAPRSAIDAVLGAERVPTGAMPAPRVAAYTIALIWSLLYSGRAGEALDLADRKGMLTLHKAAGVSSSSTLSACYAVLAETYLLNNRVRDGVVCARFARDYAVEADDDGCLYRAKGVLAAALAVSGEIDLAREFCEAAMHLGSPHGWNTQRTAGLLLLGDVLIRAREADAAGIEASCAALAGAGRHDMTLRSLTRYCTVILHAVRQENQQLVATARLMAQGGDALLCLPYLRDSAVAMEFIGLVHLGQPGAALDLVRDRTSPPEHTVCFELLRATAHLQLGDFRAAIDSTEGCLAAQRDHNLSTLVSVLLRRALAFEGLGLHSMADAAYSNANHLAFESGLLSAVLGLPLHAVEVLYHRMAVNEPEFAAQVTSKLPQNYANPDVPDLDFEPPQLTGRERVLAGWLSSDLSLREIADELHVSINTVKSQVHSLYRKLQVSSREDAVLALRRVGVHQTRPPTLARVQRLPVRRPGAGPT